jgi:sarcosine oxidase subunit alpha
VEAAQLCGHSRHEKAVAPSATDESGSVTPLWRAASGRGKAFVDFQNDVTVADIELAVREGYRSVEHVKRYTTLGMATDQGKTSSINGNALTAELIHRSISEVGSTTLRPPYTPVAIGALASEHRGPSFRPSRLTPGHEWARERGAVFMDVGLWRRAHYFPRAADTSLFETVAREVGVTRSCVGVCDVSTLGKLEIQGPGAATLLDFVYANVFSTLPQGRVRYGLMLREDGFVMDDGTTARFGPNHFLMSTTTSNAALVQRHLDYCRQVLRPELDVQVTNVTEQWAQYSIAGPRAREVLRSLFQDSIDLSNQAFPYMAAAQVQVGSVRARVFRISFSGELAYEVAVPACYGDALVRAIESVGQPLGMTAYGLEALDIMRLEKGHVGGSELNGRTTAQDLGFGRMFSPAKDFVGKTLASRPSLAGNGRQQLVGLRAVTSNRSFNSGALLVHSTRDPKAGSSEGYVTSAGLSPTLRGWIGLGLLRDGRARFGEELRVYDPIRAGEGQVEICSPHFFDPSGARLRE